MNIRQITDTFAVAPQIGYKDMDRLARAGFTTIINNRPDGEEASQPTSAALAKAAKKAGLTYHHIPIRPGRATAEDKARFRDILENADGPVLAFCRSGMRAHSLYRSATRGPGLFSRLFAKLSGRKN
ncbi:MAG TPA: TIGR01244 family phosphatase [Hellea balneolensis]|uniref:TIGR01244 family phosphatase n=1 Tax=Hellea balneolensis TaxID=287478 RepID=A0A7V5NY09_9PROT|nr:TIGR01244 family phosphatase [Hellea balneolensis]